MKMISTTIGTIAVLGLGAFAWYGPTSPAPVATIKSVAFSGPTNPSVSEVAAFSEALAKNQPLPSGWQLTANEGGVRVIDNGYAVPGTGERSWSVTVVDDQADLSSATVYVNGQSVYTATRANGGIVDRGTMSIATLPVLVPPAGQTWTGEVQWIANDGTVRDAENLFPQ